jgi:hypothetical protein
LTLPKYLDTARVSRVVGCVLAPLATGVAAAVSGAGSLTDGPDD